MATLDNTPLPFITSLLTEVNAAVTAENIAKGFRTRNAIKVEDTNIETVASYGKKIVLSTPEWLHSICSKSMDKNKRGDCDITVRFGDGQDIIVRMRSNDTRNKKIATNEAILALRVFLVASKVPALLDPADNIYKILCSSFSVTKELPEVRICPFKAWDAISNNHGRGTTSTDVTLITKNSSLQEVILGGSVQTTSEANSSSKKRSNSESENAVDHPDTTAPKKKKKKDPNAPKRFTSAYTYFINDYRPTAKAANPDASFAELSKIVAQEYRSLSPEAKEKFNQMATDDKARYEEEMAAYSAPESDVENEDMGNSKKKKRKKDPNAPKRATSVYMVFCNEMRPKLMKEHPELTFVEMGKMLGLKYKEITAEDKARYAQIVEDDKKRYGKEMADYTQGDGQGGEGATASISEETEKEASNEPKEESVEKEEAEQKSIQDESHNKTRKSRRTKHKSLKNTEELKSPEKSTKDDTEGSKSTKKSSKKKKKKRSRKSIDV